MSDTRDELDPIDGFLLEMLGDHHRHLCLSCDCAEGGCINCRYTGYDQTPCKICDKDGIGFRNRKEFLDKVKAYIATHDTAKRAEIEKALPKKKQREFYEKHLGSNEEDWQRFYRYGGYDFAIDQFKEAIDKVYGDKK